MTWDSIKSMLRMVLSTAEDELTCDECMQEVDRFVEMELAGKNPAEAMPLVKAHLDGCWECREEFEALLDIIRHQG